MKHFISNFLNLKTALACFLFVPALASAENSPHYYAFKKENKTVYVLGTVHVGVNLDSLQENIKEDLLNSDHLLVEIAFSQKELLNPVAVPSDNVPFGWSSLDKSIQDRIINRGFPMSLAVNVSEQFGCTQYLAAKYLFPKVISLDLQINSVALESGIKMSSLDNFEMVEEANKKLSSAQPGANCQFLIFLKGIVENKTPDSEIDKFFDQVVNSYFIPQKVDMCANPLVSDRNKKWLEKINEAVENNDSTFIAVGYHHLYGSCGLVQQFENLGFSQDN